MILAHKWKKIIKHNFDTSINWLKGMQKPFQHRLHQQTLNLNNIYIYIYIDGLISPLPNPILYRKFPFFRQKKSYIFFLIYFKYALTNLGKNFIIFTGSKSFFHSSCSRVSLTYVNFALAQIVPTRWSSLFRCHIL